MFFVIRPGIPRVDVRPCLLLLSLFVRKRSVSHGSRLAYCIRYWSRHLPRPRKGKNGRPQGVSASRKGERYCPSRWCSPLSKRHWCRTENEVRDGEEVSGERVDEVRGKDEVETGDTESGGSR